MIESKIFNPPISLITHSLQDGCLEISRLLAAAVINSDFCHLLLDNPEQALACGFQGEDFLFTAEERDLILSIRADSLTDLANQLARSFDDHLQIGINHPAQPAEIYGY